MNRKRKNRTIPFVAIAIGVVVIAITAALVVQHYHKPAAITTTPSGVKLAPPTAQEKAQGNENKSAIVQQEQQTTQTPASAKKQVTVTITNASNSSVNAFVGGVFEDGGTCTATFTQGSTTVIRTATAFRNVSDTQCPPITPNLPNANQWSVVVSYSSVTSQGTSPAQTF